MDSLKHEDGQDSERYKKAVEIILGLCEKSRQFNHRIQRIYDVAMEANGLTWPEREEKLHALKESADAKRAARAAISISKKEQAK